MVVAAGAVETPRLLLLSGIDHPLVGRNFMVHFQTFVIGIMNERLHGHKGRAVTHVHDDAVIVDDAARAAARAEAGLPWIRGGLVEHGGPSLPVMEAKLYPWGAKHKSLMRSSPMRDRMWAFTMQGEDLAQATNRVDLDPSVRDVRGFPVARVTYRPHRHEIVASAHHAPRLVAVLEDMGATWTMTSTSPLAEGRTGAGALSAIPMSRHVMGTTRMGDDPGTSVVDAFGRDTRPRQRRRRRLVGLRHLRRVRPHSHPGGVGGARRGGDGEHLVGVRPGRSRPRGRRRRRPGRNDARTRGRSGTRATEAPDAGARRPRGTAGRCRTSWTA